MRGTSGVRASAGPTTTTVELTFLPGLADVLRAEVDEVLAPARPPVAVPGRDDALTIRHTGPLVDVLRLRTAVAAFVVLHFDVPRPRSLTSGDHLARIVDAVYASLRAGGSSSFRFEAAGSDSAVFARLGQEIVSATGLQHDEAEGQLVVRVRRGTGRPGAAPGGGRGEARAPGRNRGGPDRGGADRGGADRGAADPGWDVLVRIGPRPLSARTWRVADYPGAVNATIAAAMVRLGGSTPQDRVLNLMCGSGTILVERLLAGPAAAAVGVDTSAEALAAATANLEAASLTRRTTLVETDALTVTIPHSARPPAPGPFPMPAPSPASEPTSPSIPTPTPTPSPESVSFSWFRELQLTEPAQSHGRGGEPLDGEPLDGGRPDGGRPDGGRPGGRQLDGGPFDVVYADPPWGTLHGSHASAADVHAGLLRAAHRVTRDGGTLVVLTHEITVMERCLRQADALWTPRDTVRVFAKGHHPRIYVLTRR